MYLVGRTNLVITKPGGEILQKEVILYVDPKNGTTGIKFTGDGPLSGYAFDLMNYEIERVRVSGVKMSELPARV